MAQMKWFRVYNDITRDRKLRRYPAYVRWAWIAVLCTASESPIRGSLLLNQNIPATIDDIADEAALSKKETEEAFKIFVQQEMIINKGDIWTITNWNKRQFESDNSADRMKKRRANVTVKPPSHDRHKVVTVTPPEYRVQSTDPDIKKDNTCVFDGSKIEKQNTYSLEFENFWSIYPRKKEKQSAFKCWKTRIKEGVSVDNLILSAENYARDCRAKGAEEQYIKHPATFLGPNKPYEEYLKTNVVPFAKPIEKPQDPPHELTDEEKYDHLPECHRPAWYNAKKTREWEEKWQREQEQKHA